MQVTSAKLSGIRELPEYREPWCLTWSDLGWGAGGPRGDGSKRLYGSEVPMMQKRRRVS